MTLKAAVIGPLCKDKNIIRGKVYSQPGGMVYYTGQALVSLGIEVTAFASFGQENQTWLDNFQFQKLVPIKAQKTIEFINEYPQANPDIRFQKAMISKNQIKANDLKNYNLNQFRYLILGPLFHHNFSDSLIKNLSSVTKAKLILSPQGMIRYLKKGQVIWQNPQKVIRILPFLDYLSLDEEELNFISQKKNLLQSATFLQKKGLKNIIVTKGQKGSLLFLKKKRYQIEAFPPHKLVDPTGAGDSYLAGFVKALELFPEPLKQGQFAAMTATMAMEKRGPFFQTTEEVCSRLKKGARRDYYQRK